jgi:hypothetical protein
MLEFGDGQERAVGTVFRSAGWSGVVVDNDLTGRPRMLVASWQAA